MGKHKSDVRDFKLPADKEKLKAEILEKYPNLSWLVPDVDFVVNQCYKDKYYLQKLDKLNKNVSDGIQPDQDVIVKPIGKLSPDDPGYDEYIAKLSKHNDKIEPPEENIS